LDKLSERQRFERYSFATVTATEEGAGLADRRPFDGGAEGSRPLTDEA
jgi:hypothetical protein